uniref:Uncharacterized protein n=1 Tax=Romanomermis culicivorax TaxID=13658 RepID=A0A915JX78_ROMCU
MNAVTEQWEAGTVMECWISMYGVTFLLVVHGCSGFIPAFSVSAYKNNKTIYCELAKSLGVIQHRFIRTKEGDLIKN